MANTKQALIDTKQDLESEIISLENELESLLVFFKAWVSAKDALKPTAIQLEKYSNATEAYKSSPHFIMYKAMLQAKQDLSSNRNEANLNAVKSAKEAYDADYGKNGAKITSLQKQIRDKYREYSEL